MEWKIIWKELSENEQQSRILVLIFKVCNGPQKVIMYTVVAMDGHTVRSEFEDGQHIHAMHKQDTE